MTLKYFSMDKIKIRLSEIRGVKTFEKFADELGIARTTYMRYEKGETPSFELLYNLCTVMHININWLFTGKGTKYLLSDTITDKDLLIQELKEENNKLKSLYSSTVDNFIKMTDSMLEKANDLRLVKKNNKNNRN